ncbi:S1C family serine protease [Demequina activiva]|uniref:Protease n=1 Tax=Demequina activiva TaxID=1582364 RepID=A0A919UJA2_9MICO|nr:trypsin-like peptidase domain-containing protein [Demequina activiva]GIG53560.1 protease [Demequina activiva]
MSDNSFAPPGSSPARPSSDPYAPPQDGGAVMTGQQDTLPLPTQPAQPAQQSQPPLTPGPDGVMYTGEPAHDASGYEPPAAPATTPDAKPPVGRVRKRTVALIACGSLVLGVGGGIAGAWAYDEFMPSGASIQVASGEPVERAEGSVAAVAAAVMPSVVSIEAAVGGVGASTGSGFIIREDGYILTNNHVIEGADEITVVMSDGSEMAADLVGATSDYDLAVLQIDVDGLTPVTFADSSEVVVGDETIAVGSPLGLESTVTTGIVSALHRPVTAGGAEGAPAFIDAIQTDAAINPGNSGGPLLNANGEVIGVNSAVAALPGATQSTGAGSVGLGFAIPSNQAQRTAEQIIETGEATYPVIGVQLDERYTGEGVKVVDDASGVVDGGPADVAGIEPGDIITAIDGRPITQTDELVVAIRAMAPGDEVVFTVQSGGGERDVPITLTSSDNVDFETGDQAPDGQE